MFKKILIGLVSILLLGFLWGYFHLASKNPIRDGQLSLKGLEQPVSVIFDKYGVPHITADNDADLYLAFGYLHAQDRLFQMEMSRRLAQGKLAEILGKDLIGVDKLFRTIGLGVYAEKWVAAIKERGDPKLMALLSSYLQGVNLFVDQGATPLEFEILGIEKHHYTEVDIASVASFMSFSFAQGLRDDPFATYLQQKLGDDYMQDIGLLHTSGSQAIPVDPLVAKELTKQVSQSILGLQSAGLFHGSNSWIIAPSRSASGHAILVNDPHIAFSQPSVWYEAQLQSKNVDIYGHFLGLVPLPMLGMSKTHAWGLTMFENDDMDLYLEKVNPNNENQYWAIDHWQDFEKRKESIKVKGQESIDFEVVSTRHGPVVNQVFAEVEDSQFGLRQIKQPVAMWWSFLNVENQMMEAFFALPKADTLDKAKAAASMIHSPGLNVMYANSRGDIGWWAAAKLPIRPSHVNPKYILDGASGKDDILGFYDFSHNPQQVNPEAGFLYSANNQPQDMGDGLVAGYYAPRDRAQRIVQLLNAKQTFSVEDMKTMLMDSHPPTAELFKRIALPILNAAQEQMTEAELNALSSFVDWQGDHSPNAVGATIYNRFRIILMRNIMQDEIGEELYRDFQFGFLMDRSIWRILNNPQSPWWDNIDTLETESKNKVILASWRETIDFLSNRLGQDIAQWQWQNDVQMLHEHPFGNNEWLADIFNVGPLPSAAGIETINNLMFQQRGDDLKIFLGPSTRRVIDFGDIENTWGINPTGQSGVVTDKHYQDQAVDYSQGRYRNQYISSEKILENSEGFLELVPADNAD